MAPTPGSPAPESARGPVHRRRALGVAVLVAGVAVLAVLGGAAAALLQVRVHAGAAADRVAVVRTALGDRDSATALSAARAAAAETALAREASSALPLRVLGHLPLSGPLVTDLQTLVEATDRAVGAGAVPLLEVVTVLDDPGGGGLLLDGGVDVDALTGAASTVSDAAAELRAAQGLVEPLDPARFPARLQDGVGAAREGIAELAARADAADSALAVLPAALGADEPRDYLVVFQNPAEARPTGGLIGTWALVTIDRGRASLTGVGSNDDLVTVRGSAGGLSAELQAVYGSGDVRLQNVNLSPDFAVAGALVSQMWSALGRPAPDGVVALDPQGMAPLLRGEGEIEVPGGPSVSADTVVDVLLNQLYTDFADDNAARKAYLSTVVGTVFAGALGGGAFSPEVLEGLVDAGREGHLLVWSPREPEQAALQRAGLSGTLPAPTPGVGAVYLTNVDASKLDYFLSAAVATAPRCDGSVADGSEELSVVLSNDAPPSVPEYVENKLPGREPTTHTTQVALYLPPDSTVQKLTVDGRPVAASTGTEAGWSWLRVDVDVARGATVTLTAQLSGGPPLTDVRTQPLARPLEVDVGTC